MINTVLLEKDAMIKFTYRPVWFPPLGRQKVSSSDGRSFLIKSSILPDFTRNRISFHEGSQELFRAEYNNGWWQITGGADTPEISLERMRGVIPKWKLWHQGQGVKEELMAQEHGIQFTNAVFPNSHIVTFSREDLYFAALAYGYLRYSAPE